MLSSTKVEIVVTRRPGAPRLGSASVPSPLSEAPEGVQVRDCGFDLEGHNIHPAMATPAMATRAMMIHCISALSSCRSLRMAASRSDLPSSIFFRAASRSQPYDTIQSRRSRSWRSCSRLSFSRFMTQSSISMIACSCLSDASEKASNSEKDEGPKKDARA